MHWKKYHYTIINQDLENSIHKLISIVHAERLRKNRRLGLSEFVEKFKIRGVIRCTGERY